MVDTVVAMGAGLCIRNRTKTVCSQEDCGNREVAKEQHERNTSSITSIAE